MVRKDKAFIVILILELIALVFTFVGIWIAYTNNNIEVSYYEVKDDFIPDEFDGFKIAHISDLHDKDWKGELESLVAAEKPDIIAITGDIVDSSDKYYDNSLAFLKEAVKIAPVYFVSGNHEANMREYNFLHNSLKELGVRILDDENVFIEKNGAKINLIGLQDPSFTDKYDYLSYASMLESKIKSLEQKDFYNIVLSHRPEYFDAYAETNANLVLCGHAHGGQVRIGSQGLFTPGQGFFPEYTEGMHYKNGTSIIISRGLGDSFLPRVNNMPELVVITLASQ